MRKIGRYEVIEELGRGAMGVVYKASDPTIGRMVAIKVLILDDKVEEGMLSPRDTFLREARAAGRLSHPGIVTIHDALEDEATRSSYIVMEFIPGRTLEKLLISSPQMGVEKAFDIIRQVAEALDYAHRNQIIHRDLKPANIILTEDNRAKITDFGIAKIAAQGAMRTVAIMGTPSYMSPEQVTGGDIDARADIFSMGILLYLMLVGEKPFLGDTAAVMFKIVYEDPVAPSKVNSKLTAADDYVVLRCLAKDRVKRYSSAREFLEDLDDLRGGRPPRSQALVSPSEIHAADRTVAAAHPLISLRPPSPPVSVPPVATPNPTPATPTLPSATGTPAPAASASAAPAVVEPPKPPVVPAVEITATPSTGAKPPALPTLPARESSVATAAAKPVEKKSHTAMYAVIGLAVMLAAGAGLWYSRGKGNPQNAVPQSATLPTAPMPPPAGPDSGASSSDATNSFPSSVADAVPPASPKPAAKLPGAGAIKPSLPPVPAKAPTQTAPTQVAVAQPAPAPAPPVPVAPSVTDITIYCKHEFEQATLVVSDGGKTVYQARLVGKKKKGFIGIGGKGFSGELRDPAAIPGSAKELTVRVYTDDGMVNLQNKVAAQPSPADASVLRVTPTKDHLNLEWSKPIK
jgi:serine/threonine protein kinase